MSSEQSDAFTLPQTMMDCLDEALKESPDIPPDVRQSTLHQFSEAMQDAHDHPKSPDEVLADWQQTTRDLQSHFDALRESGEISATDAADMLQPYDQLGNKLKTLVDAAAEQSDDAASRELPQGMPADVAASLKSSGS